MEVNRRPASALGNTVTPQPYRIPSVAGRGGGPANTRVGLSSSSIAAICAAIRPIPLLTASTAVRFDSESIALRLCALARDQSPSSSTKGNCPKGYTLAVSNKATGFAAQAATLSQGEQGRARHSVRADNSNLFAERRARSDAPYLTYIEISLSG